MKILIVGDSYAADYSVKYNQYKGWPQLLSDRYFTVNFAQAGVGQYKIYKQLQKANLQNFDLIVSSYTSSYRVHTIKHPVHHQNVLHKHSDLIAGDIDYHCKNSNDESLLAAKNYFKYHFDIEYYDFIYKLIVDKCDELLENKTHISVKDLFLDKNGKNLTKTHKGLINHFNEEGNKIIFNRILNFINLN